MPESVKGVSNSDGFVSVLFFGKNVKFVIDFIKIGASK